jgi:hypothetical protein
MTPLAPAARPMTLADELVMNTEARSAFYAGLIEGKYGRSPPAAGRAGQASPEAPAGLRHSVTIPNAGEPQ